MNEIIKKISELGLTDNESRIYYYLLQNGGKSASQIAKSLFINRANIYGMLNNLIAKGLCKKISGKTSKYYALSPQESFDLIKKNLKNKLKFIETISEILLPIYNNANKEEKIIDFIEVLHTKASITQKIKEIEKNTKESLRIFGKPPYLHNAPNPKDDCYKNENIRYKFLFETDKEGKYKLLANFYKSKFGKVKIIHKLPIKMIISDEKFIIFSVTNESNNILTTIFINNSELGELMTEIYEIYWNRAKNF